MRMNVRNQSISLSVICLLLVFSCGYHFEGGGYLKENITQVAVSVFKNKTSESDADQAFTNELVREIVEKSNTRVVTEQEGVFVIKGSINSISFETLSRSNAESVLERRVTASLDVKLLDHNGDVIWIEKEFTIMDDYSVSEDQVTDESNKQDALEKIAERFAEKLVSRLLVNF